MTEQCDQIQGKWDQSQNVQKKALNLDCLQNGRL